MLRVLSSANYFDRCFWRGARRQIHTVLLVWKNPIPTAHNNFIVFLRMNWIEKKNYFHLELSTVRFIFSGHISIWRYTITRRWARREGKPKSGSRACYTSTIMRNGRTWYLKLYSVTVTAQCCVRRRYIYKERYTYITSIQHTRCRRTVLSKL